MTESHSDEEDEDGISGSGSGLLTRLSPESEFELDIEFWDKVLRFFSLIDLSSVVRSRAEQLVLLFRS